jgi:hypothetical protein
MATKKKNTTSKKASAKKAPAKKASAKKTPAKKPAAKKPAAKKDSSPAEIIAKHEAAHVAAAESVAIKVDAIVSSVPTSTASRQQKQSWIRRFFKGL